MLRRRKDRLASERRPGGEATVADLLALARERVGEIESAARGSHEDIQRMSSEMGVEDLLSASASPRERLGAELVGSVSGRIAALHDEAAALVALFERSAALLAAQDTPVAPEIADGHANGFEEQATEAVEVDTRETPVSEGVRLLATQMAVAGSSRSEIEDRLRRELNVRDPETLVDEVLGSRVH